MNNDDKIQTMIRKCDYIEDTASKLKRTKHALDCVIKNKAELRFTDDGGFYTFPNFVNKRLEEALEIYAQSLVDDLNKIVKE